MAIRPSIHEKHERWKSGGFSLPINPDHFLGKNLNEIKIREKQPASNLKEENEIFTLEVLVPGFSKKELQVSVLDNLMTVRGKKLAKPAKKSSKYIISEFDTDVLERTFQLAEGIGHEHIEAKLKNGILCVTFSKALETEKQDSQWIKVY